MLTTKYLTACLAVAFLFLSCKKDKSYNIHGDPNVKFFTNNGGSGDGPQNSINYNVVNVPDAAGSGLIYLSSTMPDVIKVPVYATQPVSKDVMISAELDTSLVSKYNAEHNTNYAAFPDGIFNTDDLTAHIQQGVSTSTDSISITPSLNNLNKLTEESYMAPIRLTSVSDPEVGQITGSATSQVIYIVAHVELRRVKYEATGAEALGSLIASRNSWTASFTPDPSTNGSILDGSTSTYTRWNSSPGQVDVNMQTMQNVTGLRLYTTNSSSRLPTQIDVYLSNDGINYDLIGSPAQSDLAFESNYNYILFYKAIPAKYIRLVLYYPSSSNSQNRRLAEFDVYAN